MIRFHKHITLLLLILLTGTLTAETAMAMQEISIWAEKPAHTSHTKMFCTAGFPVSNGIVPTDDLLLQKNESPSFPETGTMVISNCHSSLQWLSNINLTLFVPEKTIRHYNVLHLDSSQSFIFEITDPPRHG